MTASLLVQGRGIWAHHHELEKHSVCKIGRHPDNQLRINDQNISGRHAEVLYDGKRWLVRDLGTTNGTFLNDGRVSEAALRNGDIITMGGAELVFKDKETELGDDIWGKTSLNYMKMNFPDLEKPDNGPIQLPGIYDSNYSAAEAAPDHVGRIADTRGEAVTPSPSQVPQSGYQSAPPQSAADLGKAWADQQMATILREISLQRGLSEQAIVGKAMLKLAECSLAATAMLVDVEAQSSRWTVLAVATKEGLVSPDTLGDFPLAAVHEANKIGDMIDEVKFPVASQPFLAIPVKSGSKVRGFVYLDRKPGNPGFNPGQGFLARDLGDYLLELIRQAAQPDGPGSTAGLPESKPINFESMYKDSAPVEKGAALLSGDKNRKPSKEELFADEATAEKLRLKRMEFALLVPVDRSPVIKDLSRVVEIAEGLSANEAQMAIMGRKGLLLDHISLDTLAGIAKDLKPFADSFRIAGVEPELRPAEVLIPQEVAFGDYDLSANNVKIPWGSVRLVSTGRIDRKPVIDLYCPEEQMHVRLASSVLDFPKLADLEGVHPNEAALVILRRVVKSAGEPIESHTAKHFLSGRQPKPQKFSGLREYNSYNTWLLLSYFAESVRLEKFLG